MKESIFLSAKHPPRAERFKYFELMSPFWVEVRMNAENRKLTSVSFGILHFMVWRLTRCLTTMEKDTLLSGEPRCNYVRNEEINGRYGGEAGS